MRKVWYRYTPAGVVGRENTPGVGIYLPPPPPPPFNLLERKIRPLFYVTTESVFAKLKKKADLFLVQT